MQKPLPKDRLEHILTAIACIKDFVRDINEEAFLRDIKIQSAVQYQFLIIGEAMRYIDNELLEKYPYPWHIPRSFRNYIIHEYHGIKMQRVFYTAKDLEELQKQVANILKNEF